MAFGKKPAPASGPVQPSVRPGAPNPAGAPPPPTHQRIISEAFFDTGADIGRMLKAAGASANDPSNLMMTDAGTEEFIEKERHMMLAFIAGINSNLPDGVNVVPLIMVPELCWDSVHRDFLLKVLRVTPYGSWNVLPVPKDARSAEALHLSLPRSSGPGQKLIDGLVDHIGKLSLEVGQVTEVITAAMNAGKSPRFERATEMQDQARRKLRGIGFYIASKAVGGDTLTRSREMFYGEKSTPAETARH